MRRLPPGENDYTAIMTARSFVLVALLCAFAAAAPAPDLAALRTELATVSAQITKAESLKSTIQGDPSSYTDVAETLRVLDATLAKLNARQAKIQAQIDAPAPPVADRGKTPAAIDPRDADIKTIESRVHANGASKAAVAETKTIIRSMLHDADPSVARKISAAKVHIHLFPVGKNVTDLPEMKKMKGVNLRDGRTFDELPGVANVKQADGSSITFLGEAYMGMGKSPTHPRGFLVTHEFAHVIQRYGTDAKTDAAIKAQHKAARKAGGLAGFDSYHLNSDYEYFAQAVSAFRGVGYIRTETKAALKTAAPSTYELVDKLFTPKMKAKP